MELFIFSVLLSTKVVIFFYMKIKNPATNILSAYCVVLGGGVPLLTIKLSLLVTE